MKTFKTRFWIELKLSLRQLDLLIFGLLFPVAVALILGFLNPAPAALNKVLAATSTIGIAANGLMGLPLTLADYRSKKILKQLEVTPLSKSQILLVHFFIKFSLAVLSAVFVWVALRLFLNFHFTGRTGFFIFSYLLTALVIFSIGSLLASLSSNVNTVTLLTNIIYFPMLLLSGATLPQRLFPPFLVEILNFLPLTQGIRLLEAAANGLSFGTAPGLIFYLGFLSLICLFVSIKLFRWE